MKRKLVGRFFFNSLFFGPVTPNDIWLKILDDIKNRGECAAVFDLDSTLFCVSPRSQAILRELSIQDWFRQKFPDASRVLASVEILPTEYGIKSALVRSGVQPTPGLVEQVVTFWRERFFSNTHMHHDLTYPGAQDFVRRVHEGGADVYYLTGRNESKMREGTMRNLTSWKFPDVPLERVMMKLDSEEADHVFKERRLKDLSLNYKHIWFFENEPVIIHHVRRELPGVHIVFVESTHSGKADPPTDLLTVRMDFR